MLRPFYGTLSRTGHLRTVDADNTKEKEIIYSYSKAGPMLKSALISCHKMA